MINKNDKYSVKNRSTSVVIYSIPELGIRREWQPGEVKKITFDEMEKLSYQPGGVTLMADYLQLVETEITEELGIKREPEYNMSEQDVINLILRGSLDAFLDALDFAPTGVIDLIKSLSVSLPIEDMSKRKALKEKTGFDVDKAILNVQAEKEAENAENGPEKPAERRVKPAVSGTTGRRTSGENYSASTVKTDSSNGYKVVSLGGVKTEK